MDWADEEKISTEQLEISPTLYIALNEWAMPGMISGQNCPDNLLEVFEFLRNIPVLRNFVRCGR